MSLLMIADADSSDEWPRSRRRRRIQYFYLAIPVHSLYCRAFQPIFRKDMDT